MAFLDLFTGRKAKEAAAWQLREQAAKQAKLAEEQRLAALRSAIEAEALSFDQITTQFAAKPAVRTSTAVSAQIAKVEATVAQHDKAHVAATAKLLPVEAPRKQTLEDQHRRFKHQKKRELESLRRELERSKLDRRFPRISMEFLRRRKWCKKFRCGLPLFVVFDLNQPICRLEAIARKRGSCNCSTAVYPQGFEQHFGATLQLLRQQAEKDLPHWHSRISAIGAEFPGEIPAEVRTIIRNHQQKFEALYLIAEAPSWQIIEKQYRDVDWCFRESFQPQPVSAAGGLLLVGTKQGICWLLAEFGSASAEEYAGR